MKMHGTGEDALKVISMLPANEVKLFQKFQDFVENSSPKTDLDPILSYILHNLLKMQIGSIFVSYEVSTESSAKA